MRRSGSGALASEGRSPVAVVSAAEAMPPPLPLQGVQEALGGDSASVEGGTPRSGHAQKAEKRGKGVKKDKDRKKKDRKKKERCVTAVSRGARSALLQMYFIE